MDINYENLTNNENYKKRRDNLYDCLKNFKLKRENILEVKNLPYEYKLTESIFAEEKDSWNISILKIFLGNEKTSDIYIFCVRNYWQFGSCLIYVKQNDCDYLITSEDYQCITIINLTNKTVNTYGDWNAVNEGFGFCPIAFEWEDDENILKIIGCFWGCPEEEAIVKIDDLDNPDFNNMIFLDDDLYE